MIGGRTSIDFGKAACLPQGLEEIQTTLSVALVVGCSGIGDLYLRSLPAKILERQLAAREDDDLLILRHAGQSSKHFDNPVVVRIDQRVIQHDRHMATLPGEKSGKGQSGALVACAVAKET